MAQVLGGDRAAKILAEISRHLGRAKAVSIGFIDKATYPDGTLVAAVAAYNEFGTERIPPRPFFRNMIKENKSRWPVNLRTFLKNKNYDARAALGLLGQEVQEELQTSILSNVPPPNAPATVAEKGFNRTLVDTGVMLNSVASRVDSDELHYSKKGHPQGQGKKR